MSHAGQRVLVTGAGGYIGSALAKSIAQSGPECIVLLDSSEQNLFEIDRQMESLFDKIYPVLGSAGDRTVLDNLFTRLHPEVIYHAAAFKHVPLLEKNPFAAIRNNAIGSYVLAQTAIRHGASNLALVSTDKAVKPHSIMGASKRIAELAIVSLSSPACRMNAVRLGNVIGSPGSVLPVFEKQLAHGGPLTVTDPATTRWFMSSCQAVDAILACGTTDCEGRVLVPELGHPVLITDLARQLIGAREIPIVFSGLRPGDKLTEELVSESELEEGRTNSLRVIRTLKLPCADLAKSMERLADSTAANDRSALIREVRELVPGYSPSQLLL